jgi:hypothetical protein
MIFQTLGKEIEAIQETRGKTTSWIRVDGRGCMSLNIHLLQEGYVILGLPKLSSEN